jgi:MinD-like ATPase involved in chromosome partitioning or flagellar assembly
VIVAACSDKGSPGVTTLVTVLGLVWPYERVVAEMDPAGTDLALRLGLAPEPTVLALAADARAALPDGLTRYAQPTALGVPVVTGAETAERFGPMARLWPQVAAESERWSGTVLADLGRMQPGNPALAVARAATVVLVVARPTVEGLHHLRHRVIELAAAVGSADGVRSRLAVVMVCPSRRGDAVTGQVRRMLDAVGSPVPVAGYLAEDPTAVAALWSGGVTKMVTRSPLLRSARTLGETLLGRWPELARSRPRSWSPAPVRFLQRVPS